MAWKLIVVPRARRDLEALPERARLSIIHALDDLLANPGQADLAKLSTATVNGDYGSGGGA